LVAGYEELSISMYIIASVGWIRQKLMGLTGRPMSSGQR